MGIEHEFPHWLAIQSETIGRAEAPYTGINLFSVKTENLEAVLASLKLQTEYIEKLGGKMIGLSMREKGDIHDFVWCFHYPPESTDWDKPEMMEDHMRNTFVECPKWYSLMERHDWYCLESGALPFPTSVDTIHRQVPPPTPEKLEQAKALMTQNGYTPVEAP